MLKIAAKTSLFLVYLVILSEIYLRVLAPVPILPRFVAATDFGVRGNAVSESYRHITSEYEVTIETNSKGVRSSREISYAKPVGVQRIVALGDSFVMGYGANEHETFLGQMEFYLNEHAGCNIEVVNLGVSGHGTAEELITLEKEGLRYEPDLILLGWHHTDLKDNVRSQLFSLEAQALVRVNDSYLPSVELRQRLFSISLYRFVAENSQFYSWIREWLGDVVKSVMTQLFSMDNNRSAASAELNTSLKDEKLALALINRVQEISEKNNSSFLILDIPRRITRDEFSSTLPLAVSEIDVSVYSPLSEFSREEGKMLYWEESAGHFTPYTNELVGRGLARTATPILSCIGG